MADTQDKLLAETGNMRAAIQSALISILDGLPDAVILFDEAWHIVYANQSARRISRIRPENLNRETFWEMYPEIVGTNLERVYREVEATGAERIVESFYYEPFETWFRVRIVTTPVGVVAHYRDVTAEHEAEIARVAAGEQLNQVFDATNDAVATLNRDWFVTFINRKAKQFICTGREILGTNIWESFPAMAHEDSPFLHHFRRAMHEGVAGEFEAHYPLPLELWLHVVVRPSSDGIIIFFRDVTARKVYEDAIRASEERYRLLTELNPQALWTADNEGRVLYANQRFLEYIGKDLVPRDGTEYLQCFYEGDRDRVLKIWTQCVATGEDYVIDARLLRASDGEARWFHLRALPLRNESGAIEQWLGVATDVHENRVATERLRAQYAEIERQRRELEAIYRGSPIGMALYEPKELRLIRLNDRQSAILGLRPEEALGKTIEELTPGLVESHAMIRRAARGEAVLHGEIEGALPARPNEHCYWSVNYSPIFAEDGSVRAIAGATIDITHQKRAEFALLQGEKLAAVGRLASSIAHEINNPLESVVNLIYLARKNAVVPEVQRLLDLVDAELRRVSIIATQTLRFHKQATNPQAVTCEDLFATVFSVYEGRLKNSNIQVDQQIRTKRAVLCFEADIRQVLSNLTGNAIDAMPEGGRLMFRGREAKEWSTGRSGVVLTVADTGSGIDLQTQARMFEAFFTTKGFAGTGLGLWISKGIMQRHEGLLRFRSSQTETHRGTVFTLFLPSELKPPTGNSLT